MAREITRKDRLAVERYRSLVARISESTALNPFESAGEKQKRIERGKTDYEFFAAAYFPHYCNCPCADYQVEAANEIKADPFGKWLQAWGRGLAKSVHFTIIIPMWLWVNGDLKVMLLLGQNEQKADILLSDIQAEFEGNQMLINDFGAQKTVGNWEEGKFITQNDCAFFALGKGQDPRGIRHRQYRPDYIVGDDLDSREECRNPRRLRQSVAYICEDVIPCADIRGCRFILSNNIFAPQTILTEIRDTREGWTYRQVNATDAGFSPTWRQKYTRGYYIDLCAKIGTLSFQSEYNNSPYAEGIHFTQDLIDRCWEAPPEWTEFDFIIGYWDVAYSGAKTADFNAVKVWAAVRSELWLMDAFVRQCKMYDAVQYMYDFEASLPKGVRINWYYESQFWNDALMMVFREVSDASTRRGIFGKRRGEISLIKDDRPKGNKYDRILAQLPFYQQNRIRYNIHRRNSGDMQTGIAQLMGIEPGYKCHDDSPDADAAALDKLNRRIRSSAPVSYGYAYRNNRW
ncbi:MAG: hypothetical protein LBL04_13975 [Bacteroidales bacterium]|jgi:hypothetical protein|nr:hypothetical protein [Bacteroidales bacterium]